VQSTVTADGGTTTTVVVDGREDGVGAVVGVPVRTGPADLIDSFADGLFGAGPFRLVDPTRRNVLSVDDSTMGLRSFAPIPLGRVVRDADAATRLVALQGCRLPRCSVVSP
jgi:hypothetical protein